MHIYIYALYKVSLSRASESRLGAPSAIRNLLRTSLEFQGIFNWSERWTRVKRPERARGVSRFIACESRPLTKEFKRPATCTRARTRRERERERVEETTMAGVRASFSPGVLGGGWVGRGLIIFAGRHGGDRVARCYWKRWWRANVSDARARTLRGSSIF